VKRLDPEREVRRAREALEVADTAANRTALGDSLGEQGAWRAAAAEYRAAIAKSPGGGDRGLRLRLARAELESGNDPEARAMLEALPPSGSDAENDRASLLLARALEGCGETARALALYEELGRRMAGCEALCRQAGLLIGEGRRGQALEPLTEVERRAKRLDRFERAKNPQMYDWAARTLAELRAS
jgi:hypothetical protein